jgi:hypothetical protein
MCDFFSFISDPVQHKYYYFDWATRKYSPQKKDSHSEIAKAFGLTNDAVNFYEYNPLTKEFTVDGIHGEDDSQQAETWVNNIDFKMIVEPLIIKPIVNPFLLPEHTEITHDDIIQLKKWTSVWASVGASVRASVQASVGASVWASVGASVQTSVVTSVRDSVGAFVWDSVWASVWDYSSSFFGIKYDYDFSSCIKLWESGIVPSFDGKTWRLHTGKNAKIVFEITKEKLKLVE